jgi:DUF4097 and DUF4098 domain-containing protein YvlB
MTETKRSASLNGSSLLALPLAMSLLLGVAPAATAKPVKKSKITSVVIVNGQGTVTVSACGTSKKGICSAKATAVGGIARFGSDQGDVTVAVPTGVKLSVQTTQGDVTLASIDNPLTVKAEQGTVVGTRLRSLSAAVTTVQGDVNLGFVSDPTSVTIVVGSGTVKVASEGPGSEGAFSVQADQGDILVSPKGQAKSIEAITKQGTVEIIAPGGPYLVQASSTLGTVNSAITSDPAATRTITATVTGQGDVTVRPS